VLDDWNSGYTIHKVLLPPGEGEEGSRRNLRKAITRVSAESGFPEYFTSAYSAQRSWCCIPTRLVGRAPR
jgi:hypothetical protein